MFHYLHVRTGAVRCPDLIRQWAKDLKLGSSGNPHDLGKMLRGHVPGAKNFVVTIPAFDGREGSASVCIGRLFASEPNL